MDEPESVIFSKASLRSANLPAYAGIALQDITLVTSDALADAAFGALIAAQVIGFDTESKPTFLKGEVSTGPHLIQLSTDTRAYLFPIKPSLSTKVLRAVLESPQVLKVGFGLGNDRSVLRSRLGIELDNYLDLGEVLRGKGQLGQAADQGHRGTVGAKVAAAQFFGEKLQKSKKIGTSNWAAARLSERQLLYAANDAQVALRVYRAWLRLPHAETGRAEQETLPSDDCPTPHPADHCSPRRERGSDS